MNGQLALLLLAILGAANARTALAAPANPCAQANLPNSISKLYQRLTETEDATVLGRVSSAAIDLLPKFQSAREQSCLAYIAGSASFILSSARNERAQYAHQAVRWFLYAQVRSPHAMNGRQARNRSRTAWQRLGKQPGWLKGNGFAKVIVPPLPTGHSIVLQPPPAAAEKLCTALEDCKILIELPGGQEEPTPVRIRRGTYGIGLRTSCGIRMLETPFGLSGGELPVARPPACSVKLNVYDGDTKVPKFTLQDGTGKELDPGSVNSESGTVTVSASGFEDTSVQIKEGQVGGSGLPMKTRLRRCPVSLVVRPVPSQATVSGAGIGPWGPRRIRVNHSGHRAVEKVIQVPAPKDCVPTTHYVDVILPRVVMVQSHGPGDRAVTPSRIVVDGRPVNTMSFSLQPGHYTYAALHPELGHQTGGLDIPACLTADCPGIPLKIVFANKGQKARLGVGPKSFYIAAGALLAGGIVLGALAVDTDSEIRQYSNKRQEGFGIDDLIEERDDYALAADGLFIAGGASLVTAMIWHWTGTPE